MATTITSLTNLSRFLENCKNRFARKPVSFNLYSANSSVPFISQMSSQDGAYEINVLSEDTGEAACIRTYLDEYNNIHAELVSGTIPSPFKLYYYSTNRNLFFVFDDATTCRVNVSRLDNGKVNIDNDEYAGTQVTIKKFQSTSDKVTSLSASSTDTEYPSAKCVYDLVGDIETLLAAI